jgi:light-regulated signal transduction histidine kinase (bacteriophytochrome)
MPKIQVLVVEDEGITAMDIQSKVKKMGYSVAAIADSGEEAIKKAEETHPDLVLMDIKLKGAIDGIEAAGQIRERFDIPVVYLTAFADEKTLQRAKITEPYGYILKPLKDRELNSNIAIALHKHEMERESKEYMKELERANRELKNYATTISHDLRVPLYSIQAFVGFLTQDHDDKLDEKGQNHLDMLKKASARIAELTEDLLLLSRFGRQYLEVETVDLNALIEEIKTELSTRIEQCSGEVVAGTLPTISTIKVWMKELLMSLISNGLEFNKSEKPRVEVNCEEREEENDYLFTVRDNGIGIEEENQEKIFNLFDTPQSESGGTAVGLAICKRIVTEFSGTIRVESRPGEGSTFFFTIPKMYQYFESAQ